MYTLKINCKGKRTVGRANKGINVEKNNNRFKTLKLKKKKENSIELQKPNVEAEVYNSSKKYDLKKKELKILTRFHSANKMTTPREEGKKEKNPKNLHNKSKHKNNKCFLESQLCRVLSLAGVTVHFTSLGCPPTPC